jgi:hypothetical protein
MAAMQKKVSRFTIAYFSTILLISCMQQPQNRLAEVQTTAEGEKVKMVKFSMVFPKDWNGTITPGLNQYGGHLAKQEIRAFNENIDIVVKYFSSLNGWNNYEDCVKDYRNKRAKENNFQSSTGWLASAPAREYTLFRYKRSEKHVNFCIIIKVNETDTLLISGTATSPMHLDYVVRMAEKIEFH